MLGAEVATDTRVITKWPRTSTAAVRGQSLRSAPYGRGRTTLRVGAYGAARLHKLLGPIHQQPPDGKKHRERPAVRWFPLS